MSFSQIAIKIFKANFRRYLLYFLCSSFAIMVFFAFMTIFTNKKFMDSPSGGITSNIIAPGIVVMIFSAFFVIYAQGSFFKFRKNEFGTFMVLGMTNSNIRMLILIENCLICLFSLITGLAAGTIFSGVFYLLIMNITQIDNITYSIAFTSYLYTIVYFVIIYAIVITGNFIAVSINEIVKLIKSSRREDKNLLNKPVWIIVGLILFAAALIDITKNFSAENSSVLLRSIILCFAGLYLLISNMVWIFSKMRKAFNKKLDTGVLLMADLKYSFGRSRRVLFIITLLMGITIFFSSLSGVLINGSLNFALEHNPYDITISQYYGFNEISDKMLTEILSKSETPLTSMKTLEIMVTRNNRTLLSDKALDTVLGTGIRVEKGKFVQLYQVVEDDGYPHNTPDIKNIEISAGADTYKYEGQAKLIKVLYTAEDSSCLIFNDEDFKKIKQNGTGIYPAKIKLLSFEDWHKTNGVLKDLQSSLEAYNREHFKGMEDKSIILISKPASKLGSFSEKKNGSSFLLFLFSFVGVLFFVSSAVILHFQLLTEYEREKLKYKKLHKIGITAKEIFNLISKELGVLFFTPVIAAVLIASFYSYSLSAVKAEKILSAEFSLIAGLFFVCFQLAFYLIYRVYYARRFLS